MAKRNSVYLDITPGSGSLTITGAVSVGGANAFVGTLTSGGVGAGASLGGVTMALGSDADGDTYYRGGGVLTRVPKGTAGMLYAMNPGATAPEWVSAITPAAITASGVFTLSVNGALSAPGMIATGTWITGGSTTTTKPYILIQPTGTASTNWSINGTGLGVNAPSGFIGNLFDFQLNGVSKGSLGYDGFLRALRVYAADFVDGGGFDRYSISTFVALETLNLGSARGISWKSSDAYNGTTDLTLRRQAAANLAFGVNDVDTAPVAQTLSVQNALTGGTSDIAGANWTFKGSAGKGVGAAGKVLFQLAGAGTSGNTQNAFATVLQLDAAAGAVTGLNILGKATGTGATLGVLSPGSDEALYLKPKGNSGVVLDVTNAGPVHLSSTAGLGTGFYFATSEIYIAIGTVGLYAITQTEERLSSDLKFGWGSGYANASALDLMMGRRGAASLRFGDIDAAAPVAQTLTVQNVIAGTSNTAGVDWTHKGSAGTGSGAAGKMLFQLAGAGAAGSSQNAFATVLQLDAAAGAVTALNITGNPAGLGVALSVLSSATDEALFISSKGAGNITLTANPTGGHIQLIVRDRTYKFTDSASSGFLNPSGQMQSGEFRMASNAALGWSSSTTPTSSAADAGLKRVTNAELLATNGSTGVGSLRSTKVITAKTANYTIVVTDTQVLYTNAGASGGITFTLPTAAAGLTYTFHRDADQTVTITAGASTTVRVGSAVSAAAGNMTLDAVGSTIVLTAISATRWIAESVLGSYTVN